MSHPEQSAGAAEPFDPVGSWKTWRDSGMETWSKMMLDFVNSDAYAHGSAQWLDTCLTMTQSFQRILDQAIIETLGQYKIPSTADITRLAERLSNIELKLDDLDARLDEILRMLKGMAVKTTPAERANAQNERAMEQAGGATERKAAHEDKASDKKDERKSTQTGQATATDGQAAKSAAASAEAASKPKAHQSSNPREDDKESADKKHQERK